MNKEKVIDGLTALLNFTNELADHQINPATFKAADMMITPANEKQIMRDAAEQAKRFAAARNRGGSPKAYRPDEEPLVNEVRAWIERKSKRLRGGK